MRTPIIAGNWKMNKTVTEALEFIVQLRPLISETSGVDVVVAPPFTALHMVGQLLLETRIALAAQDMNENESGAYTGAVSPLMLKEVGCQYVIIGHSERRACFGETDEGVNKKVKAALKHQLLPIMCVGESLGQREAGETFSLIEGQLERGLAELSGESMEKAILAYEPIWAIGTGLTATPQQAQEVHAFIRKWLGEKFGQETARRVRIQYGGSVKPDNVAGLMQQPDIDGALVGGASLKADSFAALVNYKK